jgi:hypothetical protein
VDVMSRMRVQTVMLGLALVGCAARNHYPGAAPEHVIACRDYAADFGSARVNGEFNACMEEAGYTAAPREPDAPTAPAKPPCVGSDCKRPKKAAAPELPPEGRP